MKTIILVFILFMSSHAIAIEPGDLPQCPYIDGCVENEAYFI